MHEWPTLLSAFMTLSSTVVDRFMDGTTAGGINVGCLVHEQVSGWMNGGCVDGCMHGWMDVWTLEWTGKWMAR